MVILGGDINQSMGACSQKKLIIFLAVMNMLTQECFIIYPEFKVAITSVFQINDTDCIIIGLSAD